MRVFFRCGPVKISQNLYPPNQIPGYAPEGAVSV